PVPRKPAGLSHRGRHGTRRGRSPGAPRSRRRAPCCWDPEVRRWPLLAPYQPPRTAGRERKYQELPVTILLICSVYKQKINSGIGKKHAIRIALPRGGKIAFKILIHTPGADFGAARDRIPRRVCSLDRTVCCHDGPAGYRGCLAADCALI